MNEINPYFYKMDIKLANLFLGFFEGLFIDGQIHSKEIEALIKWVEKYPTCTEIPEFSVLYELLVKSYQEPSFLIANVSQLQKLFEQFKKSKYFTHGTCDLQRLHGILSGLVCDKNLRDEEILAFKSWILEKTYLNDHFIYKEVKTILDPVFSKNEINNQLKTNLFQCIGKYVNCDDYGLPVVVGTVDGALSTTNPDFYYGKVEISAAIICVTGASERFSRNDWKEKIHQRNGIFTDNLNQKVNYLVVCNKGNPAWAHMSYGRKFEQAKKMQLENFAIKILTEDEFLKSLENE